MEITLGNVQLGRNIPQERTVQDIWRQTFNVHWFERPCWGIQSERAFRVQPPTGIRIATEAGAY